MSKLAIVPLVALVTTTACAANLSGDDDGAYLPPDAGAAPEPAFVACETAVPDSSFGDATLVLGIVPDEPAELIKLGARVVIDEVVPAFSIEMQAQHPETGDPMGEPQQVRDVVIDERGTFTIDELVLHLPEGASAAMVDGQTAWVEVHGGFCAETGSIQGTYAGWTFTPTAAESAGVFFVAPMVEP